MKMYNTMEDNYSDIITPDDWVPTDSLIKVVGVGGGGCNAVTYMYEQKIEGCTFIVCNTDRQSLVNSSVPVKIQLGAGRGAGTTPIKGRNAAIEAEDLIEKTDRKRETYYNYYTFGNWGVASNYDLCVDSSILGIEGTADYIIDFAVRAGILHREGK